MSNPTLPLGGLYQLGFITRDLDAAAETLKTRFGIERYRRKQTSPWMEAIHAWVGDTQVEVLQVGEGAPQMYLDYVPDEPGSLNLQHLGRKIDTVEQWDALRAAIEAGGYETPLDATAMDGKLRAVYVDTRALLGTFSEYVYLSEELAGFYDDVPRND